ncbi:tRNA methyltransferase, has a role in tRNA modification [Naganishia albida]|nr:tRNA methyltransferase, has a role in tRNA modification [Naganishia albida]
MPVAVTPSQFPPDESPSEREQRTVHDVYERIAPHFSATRYKPWPIIARFLSRIPPNSIGLDSGAGNGKYLPVLRSASEGSWMIALDRSEGLLSVARKEQGTLEECVRGDLCFDGFRRNLFDFAISIAAIHHLSTPPRRLASVRSLLRPLRLSRPSPHERCARFLIYVWAFEQGENSKRKMGVLAPSAGEQEANGAGEGEGQDVMVPWVLQPKPQPKTARRPPKPAKRRVGGEQGGMAGAAQTQADETTPPPTSTPEPAQIFHRYYHLFKAGELRQLVEEAVRAEGFELVDCAPSAEEGSRGAEGAGKWARIVDVGYEKDNWWLEGEVGLY